jgi:hypothetical protein
MPLIKEHDRQYDLVVFGATGEPRVRNLDNRIVMLTISARLHWQIVGRIHHQELTHRFEVGGCWPLTGKTPGCRRGMQKA